MLQALVQGQAVGRLLADQSPDEGSGLFAGSAVLLELELGLPDLAAKRLEAQRSAVREMR